jgi:hypothetical protein
MDSFEYRKSFIEGFFENGKVATPVTPVTVLTCQRATKFSRETSVHKARTMKEPNQETCKFYIAARISNSHIVF